jgi:predicted transposase
MECIRTISLKFNPSAEGRSALLETINSYTSSYNSSCKFGFKNKITNRIKLHHELYHSLRPQLPSQLAISVLAKAIASLKVSAIKKWNNKIPHSKIQSILYDKNSYSLWLERNEVSLLTCNGRLKLPINIPDHAKKYINWTYCSASLIFRKNKFFLNIQFKKDMEENICWNR